MSFEFDSWVSNGDFYPKLSLGLKMRILGIIKMVSIFDCFCHSFPFISHYPGTALPCGN